MNKVLSNKTTILSLIAPGFILFIFAILGPIVLSAYYSMTNYEGIGTPQFIGMENFKEIIINDPVFWTSLKNSLLLAVGYIVLQHPAGMLFAIFLDRLGGKVEKFLRVIFSIPCMVSIVVTSKMWVSILNPQYGLLNKLLDFVGLGMLKQDWLGNPRTALASIIFICIWQGLGWTILFYYAGLKGIHEEYYEAAKIDGANEMQLFTRITLPLLAPVVKIVVTLSIITALKQMEVVFLTTNGGPANTTQFLGNYLYLKAIIQFKYGYGNAISVLFVIVCVLATISLNKLIKNREV